MARTVRRKAYDLDEHDRWVGGGETRDNYPHRCDGRRCVCAAKWHKGLGNSAERPKASVRRQLID